MKLIPKCQNNDGNAFGNLPKGMNAETLYEYWDKLDPSLTDEQKAGILGNLWEESKFNPKATHTTKNGQVFRGLTQMDANIMSQFPANYGAWDNADNVFRYINDYATGRTPKIKKGKYSWSGNLGYNQAAYRAANHNTARDSAIAWHSKYERAGAGHAPRVNHANLIYAHMQAKNTSNQPTQPTIKAVEMLPHTEPVDVTRVVTTPVFQPIQMKRSGGNLTRYKAQIIWI